MSFIDFILGNLILLYALSGWVFIIIVVVIYRLAQVKVWIKSPKKRKAVAYLKFDEGTASEVLLSGGNSGLPIGRVKKGEGKDKNGYIDILRSNYEESSGKPTYKLCGYVSPDGFIYKKAGKNAQPIRIGYTARPSEPNVPTTVGERSWKTLWMVCTLNAYLGKPESKFPDVLNAAQASPEKKNDKYNALVFNSETEAFEEPSQQPEAIGGDVPEIIQSQELPENTGAIEKPNQASETPNEIASEALEAQQEADIIEQIIPEAQSEDPFEAVTETSEQIENSKDEEAYDNIEDKVLEGEDGKSGEEGNSGENEEKDSVKESDSDTEEKSNEKPEDNNIDKDTKKKRKDRKARKQDIRQPFAICEYYGFRNFRFIEPTPESRACGFAILSHMYDKNNYEEYYKSKPYGWLDTALLTSFIYSFLFLIGYFITNYVLKDHSYFEDPFRIGAFIFMYFLLWVMVRQVKIISIESLNSIQSRIDLFNKTLGRKFFDGSIIGLGIIGLSLTNYYNSRAFIPLIVAIILGFMFNLLCKASNERWVIKSTLTDDNDKTDDDVVENPDGDISRTYDWDLDSPMSDKTLHGNLTLYFTAANITDIRHVNPFYSQLKEKSDRDYILEMFHFMKEHNSMLARLRYIRHYIDDLCDKHGLHELDKIQFVLDFVQEPNIKFCMNKESKDIDCFEDYIRYPDETLYDKEADSNSKALLAAMLFHLMKFEVLYMHSKKQRHAAIGVEVRPEWLNCFSPKTLDEITIEYKGKRYVFCETTGDKFRIIDRVFMSGMRYEDFEEKIELRVVEDDVDDTNLVDFSEIRPYKWELHSELGNVLHGSHTLEFNKNDIIELRELNPFKDYVKDSASYGQNIIRMFQFIFEDDERMANVKNIVSYIRKTVNNANLPSLDMAQFTLDFVHSPNIVYRVDEESSSIQYKKEYMRFPDEVLFDKEGDCDCKASLATALFHALGFDVLILLSAKLQHTAIALECREEWLKQIPIDNPDVVIKDYNGKQYIYCETTGEGFKIGHIKDGDSIQDFETVIEIPSK